MIENWGVVNIARWYSTKEREEMNHGSGMYTTRRTHTHSYTTHTHTHTHTHKHTHVLKHASAQNCYGILKDGLNEFVCYLNYEVETNTLISTSCYSAYLVCLPTAI